MSIVEPPPRSPEAVAFLRRVMGGEVYTGLSGEALARWAVRLDDKPRNYPHDRGDFARCMNVYWSAPESLRPAMRSQIEEWEEHLRSYPAATLSWRWGPARFDERRYYNRRDSLDDYYGTGGDV